MKLETLIVLVVLHINFIYCNQVPRILLDYKKFCQENLSNCDYLKFSVTTVSNSSLSSLLDILTFSKDINFVEIVTTDSIARFFSDLDVFVASR